MGKLKSILASEGLTREAAWKDYPLYKSSGGQVFHYPAVKMKALLSSLAAQNWLAEKGLSGKEQQMLQGRAPIPFGLTQLGTSESKELADAMSLQRRKQPDPYEAPKAPAVSEKVVNVSALLKKRQALLNQIWKAGYSMGYDENAAAEAYLSAANDDLNPEHVDFEAQAVDLRLKDGDRQLYQAVLAFEESKADLSYFDRGMLDPIDGNDQYSTAYLEGLRNAWKKIVAKPARLADLMVRKHTRSFRADPTLVSQVAALLKARDYVGATKLVERS